MRSLTGSRRLVVPATLLLAAVFGLQFVGPASSAPLPMPAPESVQNDPGAGATRAEAQAALQLVLDAPSTAKMAAMNAEDGLVLQTNPQTLQLADTVDGTPIYAANGQVAVFAGEDEGHRIYFVGLRLNGSPPPGEHTYVFAAADVTADFVGDVYQKTLTGDADAGESRIRSTGGGLIIHRWEDGGPPKLVYEGTPGIEIPDFCVENAACSLGAVAPCTAICAAIGLLDPWAGFLCAFLCPLAFNAVCQFASCCPTATPPPTNTPYATSTLYPTHTACPTDAPPPIPTTPAPLPVTNWCASATDYWRQLCGPEGGGGNTICLAMCREDGSLPPGACDGLVCNCLAGYEWACQQLRSICLADPDHSICRRIAAACAANPAEPICSRLPWPVPTPTP